MNPDIIITLLKRKFDTCLPVDDWMAHYIEENREVFLDHLVNLFIEQNMRCVGKRLGVSLYILDESCYPEEELFTDKEIREALRGAFNKYFSKAE